MRFLYQPFAVAACGLLLAATAQLLLVHGLYEGDWRGLYYTGFDVALPPVIQAEQPARAPDPVGFDGQYYHVVAHSPLPGPDAPRFVDNPPLRWRRILVPGLAFVLVWGRDGAVDAAFVAVLWAFVFLGVWWAARLAVTTGLPAWLGLAFLTLPATTISLERMTVDVALAALCAGFAVALQSGGRRGIYCVLALAPLARETGVALAAAWGVAQIAARRFGGAALAGLTVAPLLCWSLVVRSRTPPDATDWFGSIPLGGLIARTLQLFPEAAPSLGLKIAAVLEYVAILGVWAALALIAVELRRSPADPLVLAAAFTAAVFVFLAKEDIWSYSYGFARTLSPAFLLLAFHGMRRRRVVLALPWALTLPRMAFQVLLLALASVRG